jgi:hypothetical protein
VAILLRDQFEMNNMNMWRKAMRSLYVLVTFLLLHSVLACTPFNVSKRMGLVVGACLGILLDFLVAGGDGEDYDKKMKGLDKMNLLRLKNIPAALFEGMNSAMRVLLKVTSIVLLVVYKFSADSLAGCSDPHSLLGVATLSFVAAFAVLMSLVHTLEAGKLGDESDAWNNASSLLLVIVSYLILHCGGDPRKPGHEVGALPIAALILMGINTHLDDKSRLSIRRLKNIFSMEPEKLIHNMLRVTSVVLLGVYSSLVTNEDLGYKYDKQWMYCESVSKDVNDTIGAASLSLVASVVVFLSLLFRLDNNVNDRNESRPLLLSGAALSLLVSSNVISCSDPLEQTINMCPLIAFVVLSLELVYVMRNKQLLNQISTKYDLV